MTHTPFSIFSIYHATFLHYTTSYDYQKYLGKTSYKEETFEHRKDKYSYHKLVRELTNYDLNLIEYYFAWLFYSNEKWVTTQNIVENQVRFQLEWQNYSRNRVENFKSDMMKIHFNEPKFIFEQLNLGDIHHQSILILNEFTGIIDKMNDNLKGNPLWDFKYKKLMKFRPFYIVHEPVQEIKFKKFVMEKI